MKTFDCVITKEMTMKISIDESVWTDEEIEEWNKYFQDADSLEELVARLAVMKTKYEDGEFLEGFGVPLINGKKPYSYINDSDVNESINIYNQTESFDVDIKEVTY